MNRINYIDSNNLKIELGCGDKNHWRDGFIHLDVNDNGQDIVWDFTKGLPFKDNSCDMIYASHTFEHIHRQDLITVFNECWRCLKSEGIIWVIVPAYNAPSGLILPHYTQFNENTFKFLTKEFNDDYDDLDTMHSQDIKIWKTIELITNERPDIHWKGSPKGK